MTGTFTRRSLSIMAAGLLSLATVSVTPGVASAEFDTSARETWSANGTVYAITQHGDRIYIGGRFSRLQNTSTGQWVNQARVAAFSATTGDLITSFNPRLGSGDVRGIEVSADGSQIYIGGSFPNVNGAGRQNLAAVDPGGNLVPGWNASTNKRVKDVVRVGDDLYIAGVFNRLNNQRRLGLGKISADDGSVRDWVADTVGGRPRSVFPSPNGNDLIVAGTFDRLDGQPRTFLGSVGLSSGDVTNWNPEAHCSECDLFDVVAEGDGVYGAVGGPGGYGIKWSATTGQIEWALRGDGNAQAIDVYEDIVYVGGHFGPSFAGQPRTNIAAINASTGRLLPWAPNLGTRYFPGVWAIHAGPDFLRLGGGFRSVDGVNQARYAELPYI